MNKIAYSAPIVRTMKRIYRNWNAKLEITSGYLLTYLDSSTTEALPRWSRGKNIII